MPEFDYAIIIPAWNEADYIQLSVAAASAAMDGAAKASSGQQMSGQLIVVDNNSSDDTAELAKRAGAQVVFEPINQISRARNAGASAANAGIYIFVDADSTLNVALLEHALDAVNDNKAVGGGATICIDRKLKFAARTGVRCWNWISRQFKMAAGCFVFCRADAFDDVGGFSLKRYAGEELVLSRALRRWGKPRNLPFLIVTNPSIETSARKMDWYTHGQLFRQTLMVMLPGALNSKRFLRTWYDDDTRRTRKNNDSDS